MAAGGGIDNIGPGRGVGSILQRRFGVVYPQHVFPFAGPAVDPPIPSDDKTRIPPPKWLYPKIASKFGFVAPVDRPYMPQDLPPSGVSAAGPGRDDTLIPPPLWLRPLIAARFGFVVHHQEWGTPPDPPGPPGQGSGGNFKPLVLRDVGPEVHPRVRKHTEQVSAMLNSLLRRGDITQIDVDEWKLSNKQWRETRAPTAFDDVVDGVEEGDLWVDLSTGNLYLNFDNGEGVATWVLIGGSGAGSGPSGWLP